MSEKPEVHVVGGGLAGSEAAWQLASQGIPVVIHEMRPVQKTEAHQTEQLAELVCSNTFKSLDKETPSGCLKEEMSHFNSIVICGAKKAQIPAGGALGVDRHLFAKEITEQLESHPLISVNRNEIKALPSEEELKEKNQWWILATGPLTSQALSSSLQDLCGGEKSLYFYDAIAPIVHRESIDESQGFWEDRYGKGDGDYFNIPLEKQEYLDFIDKVQKAETVPLHKFEDPVYFESCLPIEVMVERGPETLRFGPLKPVGFINPKTGMRPWAVIQLRKENKEASMLSLVGFQTKMKWGQQKEVISSLPCLTNAEFLRFGSIHRNTYIQSPWVLSKDLSFKKNSRVFAAGQMTGVEGYTESAAIGLLCGRFVASQVKGGGLFVPPPQSTVMGALLNYITEFPKGGFAPMNANRGLLPTVEKKKRMTRGERRAIQCQNALEDFQRYYESQSGAATEASVLG